MEEDDMVMRVGNSLGTETKSIQLGQCCRKLRECGNTPRYKILHWMNFNTVRAHLMRF